MTAAGGGKPFCPGCGKPATGNFCQHCGAKLGGRFCNQCGAKVAPAANFCNKCGGKAGGSGHGAAARATIGGHNLPWWIAGAAMFGLIVFVGMQMVQSGGPSQAAPEPMTPPAGGGAPAGTPPDLSTMTPIDAADRLYRRVMMAISGGDSTQAQQFMPMALGAYERARPLNLDGLFHLSMLQRTAMQLDAALATAEEILAADPDHLLGLAAAAEAAAELGRMDEAEAHYRRVVEVYDSEVARGLLEYEEHMPITESLKAVAEAFLVGR